MKNKTLFFLFVSIPYFSYTQTAPEIEWQNTIGGNGTDYFSSMQQTPDKGFILGGSSDSDISGDKTEARINFWDYWIVKIDSVGNVQWDRTIGGDEYDYLAMVTPTSDGGYLAGGYSGSPISGNKTEDSHIGGFYGYDYWVVKLDSIGNIEWQNTIGGDGDDYITDIYQETDGNYIVGGYSNSGISGDKTEALMGDWDFWVLKLDSIGNIIWQNTLAGDMTDILWDIEHNAENTRLLCGVSASNISDDKSEPSYTGAFGVNTDDYWIVLLNGEDSIIWQNTIGGDWIDNCSSGHRTSDNGYIIGGTSRSNISGDKTEAVIGQGDLWILKLNSNGEIQWQQTIGTTIGDPFTDVFQTLDGGYFLSAYPEAGISGDKTETNYGGYDWWVLKLDSAGNILWQNTIAGNSNDRLLESFQTQDGGYMLGGYSSSDSSVDKSEGNVGNDYWIVKLYPDVICTPLTYYADEDSDSFGNIDFMILSCDTPAAYVLNNTDCNDVNAEINPAETELCNYIDDNCNGFIDDAIPYYHFYTDMDGDDYGDIINDTITCLLFIEGYVTDSTDCNDLNNKIHLPITYYTDADGDYFGDSLNSISVCNLITPEGYTENNLDCDDTNPYINPFSNEILDSIDNNCNNLIDEGLVDIENINYPDFEIYPNPNDGDFFITSKNANNKNLSVNIYNTLGEKIYYKDLIYTNTTEMNLPENIFGTICLLLESDGITQTFIINIVK